ncbi:MAG: T9SS type A sorting domain-containing protein [Flavobacterium sp.]|nr:MAG: T9SS type A sorting domain-containing protein [Flavobacterium sp.]
MKKIYHLLLLVSTFVLAQPSPYFLCDTGNDGTETFTLSTKNAEVLGSLSASQYTVTYHLTLADATANIAQLPDLYNNVSNPQVVYARVENNSDSADYFTTPLTLQLQEMPWATLSPDATFCAGDGYFTFTGSGATAPYIFTYSINGGALQTIVSNTNSIATIAAPTIPGLYSITLVSVSSGSCQQSLSEGAVIIINPVPNANQPPDLLIDETPFDGVATFDLTTQIPSITGGAGGVTTLFYLDEASATAQVNPIVNASSFNNTSNPQTIWVNVSDTATGCFSITSFNIGVTNPDIVFFSDPAFKLKVLSASPSTDVAYVGINNVTVDTNGDGEIQLAEAAVIDSLNVYSAGISNLTGIASFTSLKKLDCSNNIITTAPIAGMAQLKIFLAGYNNLSAINLTGLTSLEKADLMNNQLTSLNLAGLSNLKWLRVGSNHLTALDPSSLASLEFLDCVQNQITSLPVGGLSNLQILYCSYNQIPTLNLTGLSSLQTLYCYGNQLTTLDCTPLTSLIDMHCGSNQLSSLNISGLNQLKNVDCGINNLTSLDASNLPSLEMLYCSLNIGIALTMNNLPNLKYFACNSCGLSTLDVPPSITLLSLECGSNYLTDLDISAFPNLTNLTCNFNQLTTLDVSQQHNLLFLNCSNNELLTLFLKNGANEDLLFNSNPNLDYICADYSQLADVQQKIQQYGLTTVPTTFCSVAPGGPFNEIKGTVAYDIDNNGCTASDPVQPFIKVKIAEGAEEGYNYTGSAGDYRFYTGAGAFTITPELENPSYFNVNPAFADVNFAVVDSTITVQNFCISANGVHPDLEVVIAPLLPARPGFLAKYNIVFKNKGNQVMSLPQGLTFTYNENFLTFLSASQPPITSPGSLTWDYAALQPFESRSIEVSMTVNSPADSPPVNIGDVLQFGAVISPVSGDENVADNTFAFNQTVVGSYDPNEISCIEGDVVPVSMIGGYLHYIINFENTGNYPAENISISNLLDAGKVDVSTLQILSSSHPVIARVTGGDPEFMFQGINLQIGGHGNILLKVKSRPSLVAGDIVNTHANIFFDYNLPVATNIASTLFQSLWVVNHDYDAPMVLYPNPTTGQVYVKSNDAIQSVSVFDLQGRILKAETFTGNEAVVDLSQQSSGCYFISITTGKGSSVQQIVKR